MDGWFTVRRGCLRIDDLLRKKASMAKQAFKLHPRPVLLLSAARPGRHLKFSLKMFSSCFFLSKTDPRSSNYFKYRRGYSREAFCLRMFLIILLLRKTAGMRLRRAYASVSRHFSRWTSEAENTQWHEYSREMFLSFLSFFSLKLG